MKPPFTILPSADCAAKSRPFPELVGAHLRCLFWMHTLFVSSILISKDNYVPCGSHVRMGAPV